MKATVSARGSRIPHKIARTRIWFSKVTRWPTSFLRAMISERPAWADKDFTCTGLKKPVRAKCASPRASFRSVLWVAKFASDLRGYGLSAKPPGGIDHSAYSKRAMAADQVELMRTLGFDKFCLAGHDRGARVSRRLAKDHPDK